MTLWTDRFSGSLVSATPTSYVSYSLTADLVLFWPLEQTTSTNICAGTVDVNASSAGLSVYVPDATLVSPGQDILFNNVGGSYSVTIKSSTGATLVSLAVGTAQYLYLTDNTTAAGSWRVVAMGGATPAASTYAGPGLTVVGSQLGTAYSVTSRAVNYSIVTSDRASLQNWTGGAGTFTLPLAATVGNNWYVGVRNSGTGYLTIARAGADTINGATSATLSTGDSLFMISAGDTAFYSVGFGQSVSASVTFYALDSSASGTITLSSTQAANQIINAYGALTSNTTLVFPASAGQWSIRNSTSGAYTLKLKVNGSAAAAVTADQGYQKIFWSDGTDMYDAVTALPAAPAGFAAGLIGAPSLFLTGTTSTGIYFPTTTSLTGVAAGAALFSGTTSGFYINGYQLADASGNILAARLPASIAQISSYALML